MRIRLYRAALHYGAGLVLHTASSGPVAALDELYLLLEDRRATGCGEVRINVAYLNGLAPDCVIADAVDAIETADWRRDPADLLRDMPLWAGSRTAPIRALLDAALHDHLGRCEGKPVAALLGGATADDVAAPSNQTLFLSDDADLLARAEAYVARGFRDLKLRVGAGAFAADLARVAALRERFGDTIKLAADANGCWTSDEARDRIAALARFGLAYIEQPLPPGEEAASARLAAEGPLPIMLDESVACAADIDRVVSADGRLWVHLKLVKLGGIGPTLAAARRLAGSGVPFMIGQMNEGGAATAAALHTAVAARAPMAELYGADGLLDDPCHGLAYGGGMVATRGAGLGITFDAARAQLIREF